MTHSVLLYISVTLVVMSTAFINMEGEIQSQNSTSGMMYCRMTTEINVITRWHGWMQNHINSTL